MGPHTKYMYTIERTNRKLFPWRTKRGIVSSAPAVRVIKSFVPSVHPEGVFVDENSLKFYDPQHDDWYLVSWSEAA
jgi:hypothetical protein